MLLEYIANLDGILIVHRIEVIHESAIKCEGKEPLLLTA